MKTYPAKTSPDGRLVAFEIENAYIGPTAIARLLQQAAGISEVKIRRLFSSDGDVPIRFKHGVHPCMVWEPYGDNSRYWVGPENAESFNDNLLEVKRVFDEYSLPAYRAMLGNLLTLRFLK